MYIKKELSCNYGKALFCCRDLKRLRKALDVKDNIVYISNAEEKQAAASGAFVFLKVINSSACVSRQWSANARNLSLLISPEENFKSTLKSLLGKRRSYIEKISIYMQQYYSAAVLGLGGCINKVDAATDTLL